MSVGAAILEGIHAAYAEWQNQKLDNARGTFDQIKDVRSAATEVRSEKGLQDAVAKAALAQKKIQDLLREETDSIIQTDDSRRAAASYRQQLEEINSLMRLLTGQWGKTRIETNLAADAAAALALKEKTATDWIAGEQAQAIRDRTKENVIANASLEDQLSIHQFDLALLNGAAEAERQRLVTAGEIKGAEVFTLKVTDEREKILKRINDVEDKLARKRIQSAKDALQADLQRIGLERSRLDADFTRTDAEKFSTRAALLDQEIAKQREYIDAIKAKELATTDGARADYNAEARAGSDRLIGLANQRAGMGADPNSVTQQMADSITRLRESWGTMAQQMGQTLSATVGGAINSISAGLSGLILKTTTWRQALWNVASTIVTTLVNSLVQFGVRWIANKILLATFEKSLAAAAVAATLPLAAAQSAIWATPATLATIATMGGAAAQAPFSIGASIAVTKGLGIAGFNEGGYTGEDGGIVHAREYVFSAPAVRALGVENLERVHRAAKTGQGGASISAGSARSERGDVNQTIVMSFDKAQTRKILREDPDARVIDPFGRSSLSQRFAI